MDDFLMDAFRSPRRLMTLPILPRRDDVCFKQFSHPGTIQWRSVIKMFSDDAIRFPYWDKTIFDNMIEILALQGTTRFLVCRNINGGPSNCIRQGQWYEATREEIDTKSRQRFLDDRKQQRRAMNEPQKPRGRPPKAISVPPSPTSTTSTTTTTSASSSTWSSSIQNPSPYHANVDIVAYYQTSLLELYNLRPHLESELQQLYFLIGK